MKKYFMDTKIIECWRMTHLRLSHLHWGGGRWRLHRREVGGGGGQRGGEAGVLGQGSGGRGSGPRILGGQDLVSRMMMMMLVSY